MNKPTSPPSLIEQLARLGEGDAIAQVAVTAELQASGELNSVMGVTEKLKAAIKDTHIPRIRAFAVAEGQDIFNLEGMKGHKEGTDVPRLLGCADFADLVERLFNLPRGRSGVTPIDYDLIMDDIYRPEDFVGRVWLFDRLSKILHARDRGYIVLAAGPGFGKTAFLQKFINQYRDAPFGEVWLGAWHILRRAQGDWVAATSMVEQIEWRLRDRLQCPLDENEKITPDAAAPVLHQALKDAAKRCAGRKLMLIIDGLDEAFGANAAAQAQRNGLLDLFPVPAELPPGIFILFTSRPGTHLHDWLGNTGRAEIIDLDAGEAAAANRSDIAKYLGERMATLGNLSGEALTRIEALTEAMTDACEGAFFVAEWFARTASEDKGQFERWLEGEPLPRGIDDALAADWNHKIHHLSPTLRALLPVLTASIALWHETGTAVTRSLIDDLLVDVGDYGRDVGELDTRRISGADVTTCLKRLRDWFDNKADTRDPVYSFRHSRIAELLLERIIEPHTVVELHRLLGWSCARWESLHGDARHAALANGPWHQALGGDLEGAMEQLTDPSNTYLASIYAELGALALPALERNYAAAIQLASEYERERKVKSRGQELTHTRRLFNIRRTLAQHNDMLAKGKSSVAAVLFNDLGGLEKPDSRWLCNLKSAASHEALLRRQPGVPTSFSQFLEVGGDVNSLAISVDGRWLAVAAAQNIIVFHVNDKGQAHEVARVGGHTWRVGHVAFSPAMANGSFWLASACWDGMVGLLALGPNGPLTGNLRLLDWHTEPVYYVAFSPVLLNGSLWLASASEDGKIGLLALEPNGPLADSQRFLDRKSNGSGFMNVTFSPTLENGSFWLVSGAHKSNIGLLAFGPNGPLADTLHFLNGHTSSMTQAAFSPVLENGSFWLAIACTDDDENCNLGLLAFGADGSMTDTLRLLDGNLKKIGQVIFSPLLENGLFWLAVACTEEINSSLTLGLLAFGPNGPQADSLRFLNAHEHEVRRITFSPVLANGSFWLASAMGYKVGLLALGPDGSVADSLRFLDGPPGLIYSVAASSVLSNDSCWLACGSCDGLVGLLALRPDGLPTDPSRLLDEYACVHCIAVSPVLSNGSCWLACGSSGGKVDLLALGSERMLAGNRRIRDGLIHNGRTFSVDELFFSSVSENGSFWLAIRYSGLIELLAFDSDGPLAPLPILDMGISGASSIVFSPALANDMFWLTFQGSADTSYHPVGLLALGPNGPLADTLRIFDKNFYKEPPQFAKNVVHVVFSPVLSSGSLWLACGYHDGKIGLLALGPDAPLSPQHILDGHTDYVHITFSSLLANDSLWLASASRDGKVGLLALGPEGSQVDSLRLLDGHMGTVELVVFSPVLENGSFWLVSASKNGKVGLLAFKPDGPSADAMCFLDGHIDGVNHVVFSPALLNGSLWMASVSKYGEVGLLALGLDGPLSQLHLLDTPPGWRSFVAFSPLIEGRMWLATASQIQEILIWSIPDGEIRARISFAGTGERIHALRWSADGRLLHVAGSLNNAPVDLTLIVPADLYDLKNS